MKPQWIIIVPLAALSIVRTLMHVHKIYDTYPQAEGAAWLVTAAVWLGVVIGRKMPNPFDTLFITGALSGVFSAIVQQAYWVRFWTDVPIAETVPVEILSTPVRAMAVASTVILGAAWGAMLGFIGAGAVRLQKKKPDTLKL